MHVYLFCISHGFFTGSAASTFQTHASRPTPEVLKQNHFAALLPKPRLMHATYGARLFLARLLLLVPKHHLFDQSSTCVVVASAAYPALRASFVHVPSTGSWRERVALLQAWVFSFGLHHRVVCVPRLVLPQAQIAARDKKVCQWVLEVPFVYVCFFVPSRQTCTYEWSRWTKSR